ncbi:CopG family transcriptional regulator, partial [Anaerovibrio lipolyticus]
HMQKHLYIMFFSIEYSKEVMNMSSKLLITKKMRGDDGYRVFSVRLKTELLDQVNALADDTGRTRNELIGMLLEFALEHSEVVNDR